MFSSDGINFREGFGQTLLTVGGTPSMDANVTWNYANSGSFSKYPIVGGVYDEWVSSATNSDPNGIMTNFVVVNTDLSMMSMNNMMNIDNPMPGGMNINITAGRCTPMFFNLYTAPNVSAPLKPFLGAPVHFTLISEDDAIYHAHGTYLPAGTSYFEMLMSVMNMSSSIMTGDNMNMMMTDPMYNLSMNAMMMGVQMNGTLNCLQDMGTLMNMPGMNMSVYYGPDTFGPTIVGIFEWPNLGNWRIWAYTGVDNGDGSTSVVVPQFDVNVVYIPPPPISTSAMGMPMSSMNGADKFGFSIFVLLLCAIITLF